MIPQLAFGSTGHVSTRTLFGAAWLGKVDQERPTVRLSFSSTRDQPY